MRELYLRGENILLASDPRATATGYKRRDIGLRVHLGVSRSVSYFLFIPFYLSLQHLFFSSSGRSSYSGGRLSYSGRRLSYSGGRLFYSGGRLSYSGGRLSYSCHESRSHAILSSIMRTHRWPYWPCHQLFGYLFVYS